MKLSYRLTLMMCFFVSRIYAWKYADCKDYLDLLFARILGVFPIPSKSHQLVFRGLIEELAKRGHHIVIITPDPYGESAPTYYENVTEIDVHDISYKYFETKNYTKHDNADDFLINTMTWFPDLVDTQLSSPAVKQLLNNRNQLFDLVFAEAIISSSFVFGAYFHAPVIGISSFTGTISNFEAVGSPTHPLLYIDFWRRFDCELTFWQKILTLKTYLIQRFYIKYVLPPAYDNFMRKHLGDGLPSITEMENNMEMLFINQHHILGGVRPTVPAVVYMGNMHLQPQKPLPKDLENILDKSLQGAIYFSLGSTVLSKHLSMSKINTMLQAFSELKYTILWKFENKTLAGRPKNVHIFNWFPQIDVLGHPNVKAFITQGGQQSMEESIHKHVPFIGIPFIGDQYFNVQKMVNLGIGVKVDIDTLSKENFKKEIIKVAEGKSYHENIKKISALIEDQPMTGKERAVWWTEYVLRHGGARHLRAPAADVTWIQYFMLDVIVPLLVLTSFLCSIIYVFLKQIVYFIINKIWKENKLKQN